MLSTIAVGELRFAAVEFRLEVPTVEHEQQIFAVASPQTHRARKLFNIPTNLKGRTSPRALRYRKEYRAAMWPVHPQLLKPDSQGRPPWPLNRSLKMNLHDVI